MSTLKDPMQLLGDEFAPPSFAPPAQDPAAEKKEEAPRDDKGRFVSTKVKREIDLGDGSGKQVFEADTYEELADKLAEAQTHATKKIREQNRKLKEARTPKVEPTPRTPKYNEKPLTTDEEFAIGQNFSQMPRAAFEKLFESVTGLKPVEFRSKLEAMDAFDAAMAEQREAEAFVVSHAKDFTPSPQNYAALKGILDAEGLAVTKDNLDYAFDQASTSGLLVSITPTPAPRIEEPAPPAPRKVSTGLSDRAPSREIAAPSVPTVEELRAMPYEQARERIARALHDANTAQQSQ
jgi:hypothetical protein